MKPSIQHKMLLSFSLITFIGLSSLLVAANKITEQNSSQIIYKDMIEARKTLDNYVKQYFLIKGTNLSQGTLKTEANTLSNVLSSQMGSSIAIYDARGNSLTSPITNSHLSTEDISEAMSGETAYTVHRSGKKLLATLSYPIEENKQTLGIMRLSRDYTEQHTYTNRFQNMIIIIAVLIFVFIYLTSFILSRRITNPIRELTRSTEQLSAGDFMLQIDINSKDEIGELSNRFQQMALRIKEQIEIIKQDRDAIKEAQSQSKAFFDNVTHELKTPLTTILGYAQVLQENGFTDKGFFEKGTSYIIKESKRLNHMVVDMIELSKGTTSDRSDHFERVDLSMLIKDTCDEMKMKGKKYSIAINCLVQDQLYLKGDPYKLKEVLINLIDNAIKYGRVNSTICVEGFQTGSVITLKVTDLGEGIPAEYINNLFEPFFSIPHKPASEKGSAGLGLAIVKNIVEKHNGTIAINSKINEGTEVTICFKGEPDE